MKATNPLRFLLLFIPFLIASLLSNQPHVSYIVAYLGSYFIFFISFSGTIKDLPKDLPIQEQLMRPIFLMQIIFAGYMCCTSIFYYINALGFQYTDFIGIRTYVRKDIFEQIADVQRIYVLGHAALVTGLFYAMKPPVEKKYIVQVGSMSNLLISISIITIVLGYAFKNISGLNQFSVQLSGLSFVSGTIALAFSFRERNKKLIITTGVLFVLNLLDFLSGGFKEPIIIAFLLLGVYLLPIFGKKVIPVFSIIIFMLFLLLPSFIGNFRSLTSEGLTAEQARDQSFDMLAEHNIYDEKFQNENWLFLTHRLSEMDMFIQFKDSTPKYIPFYNFQIIGQSLLTPIPRVIWSNKPDIERLIMERVYTANVVDRQANVSAKPAYIVDSYLSFGKIGVIIALFIYGYIAQKISQRAEFLFGGYFLGTAVMFSGLFQIFWRGNSFEFIFNSVFWSFITLFIVFQILKARGIILIKE